MATTEDEHPIYNFVLVYEDGAYCRGDVPRVYREVVRAFTAEHARSRFRCTRFTTNADGKLVADQALLDVEPYEPHRHDHQDLHHRDRR